MKTPIKTLFALCVAAALSLAACGSPSSPAGSSGAGATASGSPRDGASTAPGASGAPTAGGTGGTGGATVRPSGAAASPDPTYGGELKDFVSGSLNENVSWGCRFAAGDNCRVPIQGNYFIWTQIKGAVRFVAYKNGEKEPSFKSGTLVATRGTTAVPYTVQLPYTVPLDAVKVTFEVWLEDTNGKILARSKRNDVEVVT